MAPFHHARSPLTVLVAALVLAACTDPASVPGTDNDGLGSRLPIALAVIPELPASCGATTSTSLVVDGTTPAGTVDVHQDGATLYVVYAVSSPSHAIQATALYVGSSADGIPTSGGGNPQVGRFPHRSDHPGSMQVVWAIPRSEAGRGELVIAAYAALGKRKAGAWGAGERIGSGGSWASWFGHTVTECAAGTVGEAGGTVASAAEPGEDPEIELEIPEGALDGPVAISIEPATVADLGDLGAPQASAAGSAPSATAPAAVAAADARIVPIEGTVWEVKPSGQQFKKPVTIRIRYDAGNVPGGVDQNGLRIFLLSGGSVEGGFGLADPPRTRVDGEIEHFSYAFVGYLDGEATGAADLGIVGVAGAPTGNLSPGASLTLTATVSNGGPDDAPDAVVHYRVLGDATVGAFPDVCFDSGPIQDGVQVTCDVGAIPAGASAVQAPSASFTLPSVGTYTLEVEVSSSLDDPDTEPNSWTAQANVVAPAPAADLQVTRFADAPDPVEAGGTVTYEVDVVAADANGPVAGAVLEVRFSGGSASFVSGAAGCSAVTGGVDCALPTLTSDVTHTVELIMQLSEAGTVNGEATLPAPSGLTDSDLTNNDLATAATVIAPPDAGWVENGTLPAAGAVESYLFSGVANQWVRIHASLLDNVSGSARMSLSGPTGTLFPSTGGTAEGWATTASSANHVLQLPADGQYSIVITSAALEGSDFRVGLGTNRGRRDPGFGAQGNGEIPRGTDGGNHFRGMARAGADLLTVGHRWLRRFDGSGIPVASFGTSGAVDLDATLAGWGTALAVQPDGRIVVAARVTVSPYPWKVARFNADGTLDPSFGTAGIVTLGGLGSANSNSRPLGVGFQGNNIVVAGVSGQNLEAVGIVRLLPSGALDPAFGTGGQVVDNGGSGFSPVAVGLQSNGSILILDDEGIRRYTPDGVRDGAFGTDGLATWAGLGLSNLMRSVALRVVSGDRIVVTGVQGQDGHVMRLTSSGALDPGFPATIVDVSNGLLLERLQAAAEDAAGNLIVVGYQRTSSGVNTDREFLVLRFLPNGQLDASFGHAGYLLEHRLDDALAVEIDAAGRIVVGGESPGTTTTNGVHILRLLPN